MCTRIPQIIYKIFQSYQKSNNPTSAGQLSSTGVIQEPNSNAVWGLQFIWPIKGKVIDPSFKTVYKPENSLES